MHVVSCVRLGNTREHRTEHAQQQIFCVKKNSIEEKWHLLLSSNLYNLAGQEANLG